MSYATNSVADALYQLGDSARRRCHGQTLPADVDLVRTPVALAFVRGDRAGLGKSLVEQVVASFGYWNFESAEYLDLVFFGWYRNGNTVGFQPPETGIYGNCYREVQKISKWRYNGETDVLLVDFEMPRLPDGQLGPGRFSFKNSIYLPVEKMIEDKRVRSLDALVHELVAVAKEVHDARPLEASAFEISDRIAWTRGRRAVWERLKEAVLREWSKVYDELRPFVVCDLSL